VRLNLILALVALLVPLAAHAAEEKKPSTYSPDYCEFSATFPSDPFISQHCDTDTPDKCYKQISYTQVFDMESTITFHVICSPITKDIFDHYSAEVMSATLRAMTKHSVVKTFDTSFRTEEGYKQAGLVGEGEAGSLPTVYLAQLWIGKQSAFSVEAEMIGTAHEKADKLFSEVLKSVHYLTPEEMAAKAPEPKEDKESDETKAQKKEEQKDENFNLHAAALQRAGDNVCRHRGDGDRAAAH
jgi:hypothetical protein